MYQLKHFLAFPSILIKRQSSTYNLNTEFIGGQKLEKEYLLNFNCNNHNVTIDILDNDISLNSPVKVSCDCDSFKYEFIHTLFKKDLVFNPFDILPKEILEQKPKNNKHVIVSGCKHIIHCTNYLLSHIKNIKGKLK